MTFNFPRVRSIQPVQTSRTNIESLMDDFFNFSNSVPHFLSRREDQDFYPQLDISECDSHYYLSMDLPGVRKEDVDIKIDSNLITIKGKKEEVKEIKDVNFFTRERFYGNFQRSITLPFAIKSDKINAALKNGVLIIEAPKAEASSSQVIEIKG